MKTILIMAGGTGGHIFPGLAVAEKMRSAGWRVVWLGNPDGMEKKRVEPMGYEMVWLKFSGVRGKGLLRKLLLPFNLIPALWASYQILKKIQPNVVLGMGGYISFPCGLMAKLLGYPLVIDEQNSIAGLANKQLARFAKKIATGFPNTLPNGIWIGNPVRPEIANLRPPGLRALEREGRLHVLVLGGSLGAKAINDMVPKGLALIDPENRPQVVHQSGESHLEELKKAYAEAGVFAHCVPFIEDMAGAYEWADLVICRAGALTIAELSAAGVASFLVPYPYAVDDHQTSNAHLLVEAGAAFLVQEEELLPQKIADAMKYRREQLVAMGKRAYALTQERPNAAGELANLCAEVAL